MVSALVFGSSNLGLSPGQGVCVVFFGNTLYSQSASLHPGVQMGTGKFNAWGNPGPFCYAEFTLPQTYSRYQ